MEGYTYFFTYEETLKHRKRDIGIACALGGDFHKEMTFVRLLSISIT